LSFYKAIIFSATLIAVFVTAALSAFAGPLLVTTQEVTKISERSATASGLVANDPDFWWTTREVEEYGIYWNTTGVLNINTDRHSDRGDADLPLEFSIEMKDLQPGTTYYVWAYADPTYFRPVYGNRLSFTTIQKPEVSTQAVADIGSTTATGNGTLSVLGIPAPIQHGVCWDTQKNPTIKDEKTEEGAVSETKTFTSKITGLKPNKKYYLRAYATNATGTVYGNQVSFNTAAGVPVVTTQAVMDLTENSATAHATLVDMGEPKAVQHGVCWSRENLPAYSADSCLDKGGAEAEGPYTAEITGLEPGITYYVRAFVSNEDDVYHYGDEVSFTTLSLPVISTLSVTEISTNEAAGNGTLVDLGIPAAEAYGICWNIDGSPITADSCVDLGTAGDTGAFTVSLTDLVPGTTYFVRAFATNQAGTTYGEALTFTSIDAASAPRAVITNPPPALTRQTAYQLNVAGNRVVQYRYRLDNDPWSVPIDVGMGLSFDLTAEGPHWLHLLGKDENGVWQARQSATIVSWTLDITPPTAEMPNAPQGTTGPFPPSILVQGNDVVAYRYRLEDDGTWSAMFPVSVPITLPKLQDGPHTLAVIGADRAGNWQEKDDDSATIIKWNVDASVPTALLSHLPDAVTNQTSIAIKVTAPEGGVAVEEYFYTFTDSGRWFHGDASEPIVVSGLPEDEYSLCVNAGNGLGTWQDGSDGTSSMVNATCYTWRIDLTPTDPVQLFAEQAPPLYIQQGLSIASRSIKLTWAWQSDDELETIQRYRVWQAEQEITADNLDEAVELFYERPPRPLGYIESFEVGDLAMDKTHYFAVKTIDNAGNSSALSNVVSITLADNVPEIIDMAFKDGGFQADNASASTLSLTGNSFINTDPGNFIHFENRDVGFLLAGTVEAEGNLMVQIPLGMPTDIYWVRVVNANGISAPGPETVMIVDAVDRVPSVRNIVPSIVPIGTSVHLTISGDHFEPDAAVSLVAPDGQEYQVVDDVSVLDMHTIEATIGAAVDLPEGSYHIRVANSETAYNEFSAKQVEMCVPKHLNNETGVVETDGIVQLEDGIVPVTTVLKTRDGSIAGTGSHNRIRAKVFMMPGLAFEVQLSGQNEVYPYHGLLLPPREIDISGYVVDSLGQEAIQLMMGADVHLHLKDGAAMFMSLAVRLPEHVPEPKVYCITQDGVLELAGIQGTWQGIAMEKGGTILSTRFDTPEEGQTTYQIGIMLEHFSEYAVGSMDIDPISQLMSRDDAYGPCFIGSSGLGTGLPLHRKASIITVITVVLLLAVQRIFRERTGT